MIDLRFRPIDKPITLPKQALASRWDTTWPAMLDTLEREIAYLEAHDIIIEAALERSEIRNDGWPYSSANPRHQGIRISFESKRGPMVFECGTYRDWQQNVHAIGLTLQRLRLVDEYGATSGQQYRGFAALPPGGGIQVQEWPNVEAAVAFLFDVAYAGLKPRTGEIARILGTGPALRELYRGAARLAHPDSNNNNGERMAKVNRAKDFIEKHAGAALAAR